MLISHADVLAPLINDFLEQVCPGRLRTPLFDPLGSIFVERVCNPFSLSSACQAA